MRVPRRASPQSENDEQSVDWEKVMKLFQISKKKYSKEQKILNQVSHLCTYIVQVYLNESCASEQYFFVLITRHLRLIKGTFFCYHENTQREI